jgi:hypothetical protein
MLFARFLAENNLLIEPEMQVAISLEEAEELAREAGEDMWTFASRCAQRMLPQIFRPQDPLLRLDFAREHRLKLEALLNDLDPAVFTAEDSLGWVYQFWQAKKKDEVNASEVKIGARELPAVTQLFTEPYMVAFLLDNSLGAWWAARRLTEADFKNAGSEDELRTKAALPGVPLKYLRFVKQDDGSWTPAAGSFDGWPERLRELKTLDPCCGSGHFLVAALLMLVPMRMELEGLSACEAVNAVLRDNLHGLELDQRCVELAAFALALTAWRYPGAGGYRPLPELHVACSGLSVSAAKDEWRQLALDRHNLRLALEWMYEVFQDAPVLGYRWPAEQDSTMELSDEARAWLEKSETLLAHADGDGIVCIPSVRGERPATESLRELLTVAFGENWSPALERKLITDTQSRANGLEDWLRNHFFEQHCKLFHHRPFIWHIWDGRTRDGFHALVNYHQLAAPNGEGRKLLENLTYSYLGDWIARQRDGVKRGEGGADDRLAAALELEKCLKAILDGEPPFDIFARWKPLHQQSIGWEPDINDGVCLNIRPFMAADLPNGRNGAGILRWKPNINWGKDRGKEPNRPQEQYPWFWKDGTFIGDRVNDIPLTNDEKRRARKFKGTGNDA